MAFSFRDVRKKLDESDKLGHEHSENLFYILSQYTNHFPSKPGLCELFEYEYQVQFSQPTVGHTQPIPFSVRAASCKAAGPCFRVHY
jgi:hypothetical protein